MTERHKWADEVIAMAEGKTVQFKSPSTLIWFVGYKNFNPISRPDLEWRIKTEPVTVWVAVSELRSSGAPKVTHARPTKELAEELLDDEYVQVVPLTYVPGEGLE